MDSEVIGEILQVPTEPKDCPGVPASLCGFLPHRVHGLLTCSDLLTGDRGQGRSWSVNSHRGVSFTQGAGPGDANEVGTGLEVMEVPVLSHGLVHVSPR